MATTDVYAAELLTARQSAEKALSLSRDPCRARCVELECLLQAKNAQMLQLEAERDAQARSHAVRLEELQTSCHKKVCQLQRMHREQLSAAQASAAIALTAAAAPAASAVVTEEIKSLTVLFEAEQAKHAAECSALQDKLIAAEQHQHSLQMALQTSTRQASALQQEAQQSNQALQNSQASQQELMRRFAEVQARCKTLEQQPSSAQGSLAKHQGKAEGAVRQDTKGVLQLLEQQLISLSKQLRSKEQQVAALQQTVKQQCDERTMLQIRCMHLETASASTSSNAAASNAANQANAAEIQKGRGFTGSDKAQADDLPDALIAGSKSNDKAGSGSPGKARLSRLASASEQQHGKSGLLGRIMATSSTTGKISC